MNIQEAKKYSWDQGVYPLFFSSEVGCDFKLESHPDYFCVVNSPRKVKIKISSFLGVCAEARHYYATIIADGIDICSFEQIGSDIRRINHGGYLGEEFENLPTYKRDLYSSFYRIDVCRTLSASDISKYPERWVGYYEGCMTPAFDTKFSAIRRAKAIVAARFSSAWKVEIEEE
ncbi:MAG TPA: hypothetical protein H9937_04050 [Candidatus Alistipes stercorigallinarum]|nr:hypothetical protein [Candidatus Alistipes stercorigallinarum]